MRTFVLALALATLVGVGSAAAAPGPPQNTAKPTISGAARQPQTLTADRGTWTGTQPISYAFQWLRCDSNGNSCARIIGATADTYKLTSADVGNTLRVRVRASNSGGVRLATSDQTAVVRSQAPESIALDADSSVVTYGRPVALSGTVDNADAGVSVAIIERRSPSARGLSVHTVTAVKTDSDGSFSANVRPVIHSTYTARAMGITSNGASVQVRPLMKLTHAGFHRYILRAFAARSLKGRVAVLQRWSTLGDHWVSVSRVRFTRTSTSASHIASLAIFRAAPGRVKIRMSLSSGQAAPGYAAAVSNSVTG